MIKLLDGPFLEYDLDTLLESKSLHSLDSSKDAVRQAVIDAGFSMDRGGWKTRRRHSTTHNKKKFDKLQNRFYEAVLGYTRRYKSGEISKSRWMEWVRYLLRSSYQEAFSLGVKSTGIEAVGADVAPFEEKWVKTASKHEMRYFNRLLDQIAEGRQRGTIEKRLKSYSDALKNVYYSGRIMGTPTNHLIDWVGPNDRSTCISCKFLIDHSPFTKDTLPTTPRAGDTKCLNNCRDRLLVREVTPQLFEKVRSGQRSKKWYQNKLLRLKEGKIL